MRKLSFLGGAILLLHFFSCKKIETVNQTASLSVSKALTSTECSTYPIIDSMPSFDADADTAEIPTILGNQRTNPYTLANMRQAYNNLGYSALPVNATNQYVRFLPNSAQQLSILDSTLDAQGLEMFDAPIDYDILQEGDYYQDPSIPDSLPTWQYAVVPANFQAPTGITYQVLSQIHIPTDDYTAVETEGERLASIQDSINCSNGMMQPQSGPSYVTPDCFGCGGGCSITGATHVDPGSTYTYYLSCGDGSLAYSWDLVCGTTNEWTGNEIIVRWNSSGCTSGTITAKRSDGTVLAYLTVTIGTPPPPPPPPPPAIDAQVPAGMITVSDVNLNTIPGVRNVRVVAKRWFKIERTYTDNNGNFQFTKRFKHKVKIVVRFKNSYCNIRGIRGTRIWQSLYAVRTTIGVFSSNKNSIPHNFDRLTNSTNARGNRYWVAATVNNAIIEHRDYATQYGFSAAPMGLNIYITNWGITEGLASTPLFGKRFVDDLPASYINTYLIGLLGNDLLIGPIVGITRRRLDMAIDYHRADMSRFTSDFIKETVYHECSHASQYTQMGTGWYTDFVNAELAEIQNHPSGQYNPYGDGTTSNSPIIALGEAWGYHMGHFLADQRYGLNSSQAIEQGIAYTNNNPVAGLSSHLNLLEDFNPNRINDPFYWIPQGLMYDLIDNRNDNNAVPRRVPLDDQVVGYTTAQLFNALQSDITTLQAYHTRLISQTSNNPAGVNTIFTFYGY
jgi:hypothetical protein